MTETTLRVEHDMVLSDDLVYTKFNTDVIKNQIELNTLEKAFVSYPSNSKDSTSITWNLPSISGGAMVRELELEIPLTFQITFKGVSPNTAWNATLPVASGGQLVSYVIGTQTRPFMNEINCLDQFPLSKIFNSREYTINNSSTILKEDFTPEQIDVMVAQLDLEKVKNAGLEVFADANCHFSSLSDNVGGIIVPGAFARDANPALKSTHSALFAALPLGTTSASQFSVSAVANAAFVSKTHLQAGNWKDSWMSKRNSARNIVNSTVTFSGNTNVDSSTVTAAGCGSNKLPRNSAQTSNDETLYTANTYVSTFTITVREQLLSQFFDNEYTFNKFSWNKLLPASSLQVKLNINSEYLSKAVLKIGDHVSDIIANSGLGTVTDAYKVSNVTIGNQQDCKLYVRQCKIPLALLPRSSYKVMYYAQDRPQGRKQLTYSNSGGSKKFETEMQYSNLSQIPEYVLISLPVDKTSFVTALGDQGYENEYQFPSTLNLPITNLQLTFNQDTALATYGLDMHTLQKYTLENLQDCEKLRELIQGKETAAVNREVAGYTILNTVGVSADNNPYVATTAATNVDEQVQRATAAMYRYFRPEASNAKYSAISNSSFYILKMGSQIRLPEGYCPGMIVNYNLSVKATCDLSVLNAKRSADVLCAVIDLIDFDVSGLTTYLDVVHFNKRIFTLSGDALQNVYVHNSQITSSEFLALRNQFQANFGSMSREDVFDSRMMIGGSFFSRLKDKAVSAFNWLKPKVESALKTGREAVDLAKRGIGEDSGLRKYVDMADRGLSTIGYGKHYGGANPHEVMGGMDEHEVMAEGRKRGPKKAPTARAVDWRSYLQKL